MKRLAVVVAAAIAGMGWALLGCGADSVAARAGGSGSGLMLADSVTQTHFSLSVMDGAPTLTDMGGAGTVGPSAGLIDTVTGAEYGLAVTNGALTLVPGSSAVAAKEIGLADSATAKSYELAVVNGALTLTQGAQ
jgi:hypothetical protein